LITFKPWVTPVSISPVLHSSTCRGKQTVGRQSSVPFAFTADIPGYSVIDFSLVDPHFGNLQAWVDMIEEMHRRDMYLIADFTVGTMGDMIGVEK
jgi:glycosidase